MGEKMTKTGGIRELYTPESAAARYDLYRGATGRIKAAIEAKFWIEAIALCESVIADRLEARISHLNGHSELARRHGTIGGLVRRLQSTDPQEGFENLHKLYGEIRIWTNARNKAVHNAVKLTQGQTFEKWDARYAALETAAVDGFALFKALKSEFDRIKRRDAKTK